MYYIFRLEKRRKEEQLPEEGRKALVSELEAGYLRQGWGRDGMKLLDGQGKVIPQATWMKNFQRAARKWDPKERTDRKAKTHYVLLSNMLKIREGDLLAVPNIAKDDRKGFVVAKAVRVSGRPSREGECYDFSPSVPDALDGDRRHFVAVDKWKIKFIPYSWSAEAAALPMLIKNEGLWSRVWPFDSTDHPKLVKSINRLSLLTDGNQPKKTLKNVPVSTGPTSTQQERGLKGEKEIYRRLNLPGGWLGLRYVDDRRSSKCGYDFLCTDGKRKIELEVKSYEALTGQIFFTENELRQAVKSKERYHLWALLDNGGDPKTWELISLKGPYAELKRLGKKVIQIFYRIPPSEVRWEDRAEAAPPRKGRRVKGRQTL